MWDPIGRSRPATSGVPVGVPDRNCCAHSAHYGAANRLGRSQVGDRFRARDLDWLMESAPCRPKRARVWSPYPSHVVVKRIETACPPQI